MITKQSSIITLVSIVYVCNYNYYLNSKQISAKKNNTLETNESTKTYQVDKVYIYF